MQRFTRCCVTITFLLSFSVSFTSEAPAFSESASFNVTQNSDLATPFGGMGFDPGTDVVSILARYVPNATNPLTIFEFDGTQMNFGNFIRDFSCCFFTSQNITSITMSSLALRRYNSTRCPSRSKSLNQACLPQPLSLLR